MPPSRDHPLPGVAHDAQPPRPPPAYAPAGFCPGCGYRMDAGRCPECGRRFGRAARVHPRVRRRVRVVVTVVLIAAIAVPALYVHPAVRRAVVRIVPSAWLAPLATYESGGYWNWALAELQRRLDFAWNLRRATREDVEAALAGAPALASASRADGRYRFLRLSLLGGSELAVRSGRVAWTTSGALQPGPMLLGEVESRTDDLVVFRFRVDHHVRRTAEPFRLDTHFAFIEWDAWAFLVPIDELIDFCNDVNAGEALPVWHHTRCADADVAADVPLARPEGGSLPGVPAPLKHYLLRAPITATVTHATPAGEPLTVPAALMTWFPSAAARRGLIRLHDVTIDAGADHGLRIGMRLYPRECRGYDCGYGTVIRLAARSATLRWIEYAETSPGGPATGDNVATVAPPLSADQIHPTVLRATGVRSARVLDETLEPSRIAKRRWPLDSPLPMLREFERRVLPRDHLRGVPTIRSWRPRRATAAPRRRMLRSG